MPFIPDVPDPKSYSSKGPLPHTWTYVNYRMNYIAIKIVVLLMITVNNYVCIYLIINVHIFTNILYIFVFCNISLYKRLMMFVKHIHTL